MIALSRCIVATALLLACFTAVGCDSMRSTLAPEYRGRTIPVRGIGIAGPGASLATQEFIAQGYHVHELGTITGSVVETARNQQLPYVAVVDGVDTSTAVWDGMYSFSMRVSDTDTGVVVWSASGTYGQGGIFIDLQTSSKNAMKAMIADFGKTFPPDRADH
jgi:hypothetical protein